MRLRRPLPWILGLAEVHGEHFLGDVGPSELSANAGARLTLTRQLNLLMAAGVRGAPTEGGGFMLYTGCQFNIAKTLERRVFR